MNLSDLDPDMTTITIRNGDKYWELNTEKVTWAGLLEELLYGLRGMGYFIDLEVQEAIMEATSKDYEY